MNDNQINLILKKEKESDKIIETLSDKLDTYKMGCLVLATMVIILILFK